MTPEQKAREAIDQRLIQAGWILQDMRQLNPMAGPGVAVREFPTSTGPVDYALLWMASRLASWRPRRTKRVRTSPLWKGSQADMPEALLNGSKRDTAFGLPMRPLES